MRRGEGHKGDGSFCAPKKEQLGSDPFCTKKEGHKKNRPLCAPLKTARFWSLISLPQSLRPERCPMNWCCSVSHRSEDHPEHRH